MLLGVALTMMLAVGCGGGDDGDSGGEAAAPPVAAAPTTQPTAPPAAPAPTAPAPALPAPVAAVAGGVAPGTEVSVVKTNPVFQDCVAVRSLSVGDNTGNTAAFSICRSENLREMVNLYIAGVNAYDVDALLPLLEAGYRAEQESALRTQLEELKAAGAQLTWTEDQLPGRTGPSSMALVVTVDGGPSGTAQWQFGFIEVGETGNGDWFINFVNVK